MQLEISNEEVQSIHGQIPRGTRTHQRTVHQQEQQSTPLVQTMAMHRTIIEAEQRFRKN